jgi:hypothetical protein
MYTALAWTAIVGSVITSRAEDCVAEANILRQLLEASSVAVTHAQGPELQRWRLWRLVRQILTILPDEDDPNGLLAINTGGHSPYVSLGTWVSADDKSLEIIECFHLLMCRAVAQPSGYNELLQREFKYLAHLLHGFGDPSNVVSSPSLANACLGIILQNIQVLLLQPTENLWPALWRYAAASGSTTSQRLFEALVASDVVTSSHFLLSQCFQAIHDSIVSSERYRSDFAYKILLAMPCRNIKRSRERAKLVKLLEDGGVAPRDGEMSPARSSKPEDPLFQEFKTLYSSSSTTTRHGRRLIRTPLPRARLRQTHSGCAQSIYSRRHPEHAHLANLPRGTEIRQHAHKRAVSNLSTALLTNQHPPDPLPQTPRRTLSPTPTGLPRAPVLPLPTGPDTCVLQTATDPPPSAALATYFDHGTLDIQVRNPIYPPPHIPL